MFPRGAPGIALLILRVSVGVSILLGTGPVPQRGMWMLATAIALSTTLLVGFLTPIAALLAIPVYLIDPASLKVAPTAAVTPILQAFALSLLGPRSYSIDAHLHGQRLIEVPRKIDPDTS